MKKDSQPQGRLHIISFYLSSKIDEYRQLCNLNVRTFEVLKQFVYCMHVHLCMKTLSVLCP